MTAHHKIVLLFKDGSSEEFLVGLCSPAIPNFDTAGCGPLSQPFYVDSTGFYGKTTQKAHCRQFFWKMVNFPTVLGFS